MSDQRSLIDRLVNVCISLLIAAVAVYAAVHLIEAVWAVLLLIGGSIGLLIVIAVAIRRHTREW
jgi:hypothetical protein